MVPRRPPAFGPESVRSGLTFQGASGGSCSSSGARFNATWDPCRWRERCHSDYGPDDSVGTITATASANANDPSRARQQLRLRDHEGHSPAAGFFQRVRGAVRPSRCRTSDGRDVGQITVGSRLVGIDDTAPDEIALTAEGGESLVEAVLTSQRAKRKRSFESASRPGSKSTGFR